LNFSVLKRELDPLLLLEIEVRLKLAYTTLTLIELEMLANFKVAVS